MSSDRQEQPEVEDPEEDTPGEEEEEEHGGPALPGAAPVSVQRAGEVGPLVVPEVCEGDSRGCEVHQDHQECYEEPGDS